MDSRRGCESILPVGRASAALSAIHSRLMGHETRVPQWIMGDMASLPATPLTEDQYLEIERLAESKNEFHDGQMFAMAGGSPNHSLLANRVGALLDGQMPPGCRTFNADLRIKIASYGLYTYADCSVICGDLQYADDRRDVVLNPLLIVEVLSPSTEGGGSRKEIRVLPHYREFSGIPDRAPGPAACRALFSKAVMR